MKQFFIHAVVSAFCLSTAGTGVMGCASDSDSGAPANFELNLDLASSAKVGELGETQSAAFCAEVDRNRDALTAIAVARSSRTMCQRAAVLEADSPEECEAFMDSCNEVPEDYAKAASEPSCETLLGTWRAQCGSVTVAQVEGCGQAVFKNAHDFDALRCADAGTSATRALAAKVDKAQGIQSREDAAAVLEACRPIATQCDVLYVYDEESDASSDLFSVDLAGLEDDFDFPEEMLESPMPATAPATTVPEAPNNDDFFDDDFDF